MLNRLISVAPMMDWTDRHDRYFLRLIAPHILLYTEMVTTQALQHGDRQRLLAFHPIEHPVALQLGGSEPDALSECARMGEDAGYDEINLNVGCPSSRVQSGRFGACLMLEPLRVADCVASMVQAVHVPVTVKCRIGVDDQDDEASLHHFIRQVAAAGCGTFIVHARKAWLSGLSPKENREIPPLHYECVYQLKKQFPALTIIINGGVKTSADVSEQLAHVDGVMIGREAYANPYWLAELEQLFFSDPGAVTLSRHEVIEKFIVYVDRQLQRGVKLSNMTRHILGLFVKQKGARAWRRYLSEHAHLAHADALIIREALRCI